MRIHLVAPTPHRDIVNDWEPDAYVGKCLRLCTMLTSIGHDVTLYAGPRCDAPVAEHVPVVSDGDRAGWFTGETWEQTVFDQFDPTSAPWRTVNARTVAAIRKRIEPRDIVFLTMGSAQRPILEAFPAHVVAESGVGYEGVLLGAHRCYESYAWMHYIWGRTDVADGRWFDTVIPNAFDPADLQFSAAKDDYLLYMGRLIPRKGLEVVAALAEDHRVITAGQGEPIPGVEHVGVVRGQEKAELLARARAVLCPTMYVGPFEGVNVEAQLSGTPVLTTPFGAFTETVAHGTSGFLCHTLGEFRAAVDLADGLDPKTIRDWAAERFTLEACAPQYDWWLHRLQTLYFNGWYS